jgi:hypothetical protein
MTEATLLPFDLPAVHRKKLTVDFEGGSQSSDGGLLLLREAERSLGICARLAGSLTDRRDPGRVRHQLVELIKARALAICVAQAAPPSPTLDNHNASHREFPHNQPPGRPVTRGNHKSLRIGCP